MSVTASEWKPRTIKNAVQDRIDRGEDKDKIIQDLIEMIELRDYKISEIIAIHPDLVYLLQ